MDIVERLRTQPPRDLSGLTHDLREDAAKEIERLREAMRDIRDAHIGDQPAALNVSDEEWARRCHGYLRAIARGALAQSE